MIKSVSSFASGLIALLVIPTLLVVPAHASVSVSSLKTNDGSEISAMTTVKMIRYRERKTDFSISDDGSRYVQGETITAIPLPDYFTVPNCSSFGGWRQEFYDEDSQQNDWGPVLSFPYTPTTPDDGIILLPSWIAGACATTPGSAPNSQVATIPAGLTGGNIAATASLPSIKFSFAETLAESVITIAPVSNPAASSSTPFTVADSTKIVDINVTGLTGNVTVCLDGGPTDNLYHFTGGAWVALPERSYANGQVCGVTSSFSPFAAAPPVVAVNSPAPVVDNSAALAAAAELASRTVSAKKKYSAKSLAVQVGVKTVSPKAAVSISVAKSSKKVCTKSGSRLKTLTAGNCVVTITVQEPKPKGGKKPKATKTVKSLVVK